MSGYKEKDAARDTNTTSGEVARAHHQARTDSRARTGSPRDRPTRQNVRDARRKMDEVIERGKARDQKGRSERSRER
jgi:hypothetical protein